MEIVDKTCNSPEYCKINLEWLRFCSRGTSGHILIVTNGDGVEGWYWHLVERAKDADEHPIMHRKAPITKNYLAPDDISWLIYPGLEHHFPNRFLPQ